jgi:uncharacterized protein
VGAAAALDATFSRALVAGTERLCGWADLLDRINVFPVADGDTGRNLVLSLSPFLGAAGARAPELRRQLLLHSRGNSGNIAARFFAGFLDGETIPALPRGARLGRELAWAAVPAPHPGTMLSLFDELCAALDEAPPASPGWIARVIDRLERAVKETTNRLPRLSRAGVVDSGALGMFLFFEGFLSALDDETARFRSIPERFAGRLTVTDGDDPGDREEGCCVDAVIDLSSTTSSAPPRGHPEVGLADLGKSLVTSREGALLKIHLHTGDERAARERFAALGAVVAFSADDLVDQTRRFRVAARETAIHVMTDAAGTLTREDADDLGVTLLDSYVNFGGRSVPETRLRPEELYAAMRGGVRATTSQASVFERHQHYEKVLALHDRVLYLCVGSAFTGNHRTAVEWKRGHDPQGRLTVVDSGAASGRLGLAALSIARLALATRSAPAVVEAARRAVRECVELVFLDRLEYLAAGGRLGRTSAFFGDLLGMKPVVSPLPDGARKLAVLRSRGDQLKYLRDRLEAIARAAPAGARHLFLLEHTDNEAWVGEVPGAEVARRFPDAEVLQRPVSLTSGCHMGPGTWGIAHLTPEAA